MSENRETYYLYAGRLFRDAGFPTFESEDDEPLTIRDGSRANPHPRTEDPSSKGQEPVGEDEDEDDNEEDEVNEDEDEVNETEYETTSDEYDDDPLFV